MKESFSNVRPLKSLGQNFLIDENISFNIAQSIGNLSKSIIIEIGSGYGSLSKSVLELCRPLFFIGIEKDNRLMDSLNKISSNNTNVLFLNDDALKIDEIKLFKNVCEERNIHTDEKMNIVGNLPYNISTELIFKWLKIIKHISSITIMLQKEVAERICATNNNSYSSKNSAISFIINAIAETEVIMTVPNSAFYPVPKVQSAVIRITPKKHNFPEDDIKNLSKTAKKLFLFRRKMISNAIKLEEEDWNFLKEKFYILKSMRAENLSIEQLYQISKLDNS